ncbi:MAG: hypothetical protein HZA79_12035 [Sphingobacteriales bacterium]|nr:hypothetical protein [Sphingobacteriales bacterium]
MSKLPWLLPVSILLYACPYESNVALESAPVEPVDTSLNGYWYGIVKDGSDFFGIEALEISRQSDSVYSITRYGKVVKGDMILPDTAFFTGFTSRVQDQQFMNISGTEQEQPAHKPGTPKRTWYLAAFSRRNDTLDVRTLTETFTTRKFFQRPGDLKQLVLDMGQKNNIFDDLFSLSYRKIAKPVSFQSR